VFERDASLRRDHRGEPLAWAVVASLVTACGGQPTPRARAADDGWTAMSWEDRHDTMTFAVLPNMARLFQRFSRSPYPDMTCRTCHGEDAERVRYKMPHGLPALDPAHLPSAGAHDPAEGRLAKFMTEEVTPQMADLLGVPVYDPKSRTGFSCFNCHPSL
jgi:hypothetical protein